MKSQIKLSEIVPGTYVVAVSGGVDSMVLLDILSREKSLDLVVAHFDHGIRADSQKDCHMVKRRAQELGLDFEFAEGKLGPEANEASAREARYNFLNDVKEKHQAVAIITAHHQDDAIETLLINLIRGTGRRGVLSEGKGLLRPLLNIPKKYILEYAKKQKLLWRDDPTNQNTKYLRNYVRLVLLPKLEEADPGSRRKLLNASSALQRANLEIDQDLLRVMSDECKYKKGQVVIPRQWLIMLPNEVGKEVVYSAIRHLDMDSGADRRQIERLLFFAKTAKNGKLSPVNKRVQMRVQTSQVLLEMV